MSPSIALRRNAVAGLVLVLLALPGLSLAEEPAPATGPDLAAIERTVAAQHDASLQRLKDWIALPSIAAENLNAREGAEYMARLAREAGFQQVEIIETDGKPGVFATLDAGAEKTVGLYFMYDVKQYDPAEWSSPPLESRLVDRPGLGKVLMGRGAVNQKGPQAAFLGALHAIRDSGQALPVNLVLVAEGEEEIGSPHIGQLVYRPEVEAALRDTVGVFMPYAAQDSDGNVTIALGAKGVAAFGPTDVLVECDPAAQARQDAQFAAWRDGDAALTVNEVQQIGFHVAGEAGLSTVTCFDEGGVQWEAGPMFEYMAAHASERKAAIEALFASLSARHTREQTTLPLPELLRLANDPARDRENKALYIGTNDLDAGGGFAGADAAASWWQRNFRMYANVQQAAARGRRGLVVAGQGHTAILRDLLALDGERQAEDVMPYLVP